MNHFVHFCVCSLLAGLLSAAPGPGEKPKAGPKTQDQARLEAAREKATKRNENSVKSGQEPVMGKVEAKPPVVYSTLPGDKPAPKNNQKKN